MRSLTMVIGQPATCSSELRVYQLKKSQTTRFNNSVDQVKADKEVDTRTEEVEEEIRDTDLRMTERNNSGVV